MNTEKQLLQAVKNDHPEALDELIRLYYPRIFRYCLWHTKTRAEAEDCTQETMIKALRYIQTLQSPEQFRSFIYQVARSICTDHFRKHTADLISLDELNWDIPALSYEKSITEEEETLIQYTNSLPPDLREVILLRFAQDLSIREIAAITGVPLRTAQSRLNRALRRLRKELMK